MAEMNIYRTFYSGRLDDISDDSDREHVDVIEDNILELSYHARRGAGLVGIGGLVLLTNFGWRLHEHIVAGADIQSNGYASLPLGLAFLTVAIASVRAERAAFEEAHQRISAIQEEIYEEDFLSAI